MDGSSRPLPQTAQRLDTTDPAMDMATSHPNHGHDRVPTDSGIGHSPPAQVEPIPSEGEIGPGAHSTGASAGAEGLQPTRTRELSSSSPYSTASSAGTTHGVPGESSGQESLAGGVCAGKLNIEMYLSPSADPI
ncbi:unnamed protein product [Aspergillus oryzae var. brunneus]|uniref:Unnamed protein product n=1 Tax=Aspergillus oryzae var. brunneus TaxID=332754 RepID=A0ABQ6KAK5_ASPOZ|nr:unnamed protein product [Aspergillus oryzae var. brunneus]